MAISPNGLHRTRSAAQTTTMRILPSAQFHIPMNQETSSIMPTNISVFGQAGSRLAFALGIRGSAQRSSSSKPLAIHL